MKKLLGYIILAITLAGFLGVYIVRDHNLHVNSFQEQCEILSLQYELRQSRELLQEEVARRRNLPLPEEFRDMKEYILEIESQMEEVGTLLKENFQALDRLGMETNKKLEAQTGQISEAVAASLKTAEGKWAKEINRISGITNSLSTTTGFQKEALSEVKSLLHRDLEAMERLMVLPTIQLNGIDTVGSGVLIYSELEPGKDTYATYALTSYHVVRNILSESEEGQKSEIRVNIYERTGQKEETAEIVEFNEDIDVALLRLQTDRRFSHVARLYPKEKAPEIRIFTPIYAVGCPLGNDPIPTVGEISSIRNQIGGQNYWMVNASTYFGNSGGGIFLAKSHELIGIFSKIYTHGYGRPVVISHMGLATPIDVVHDWLESIGYGYLRGRT